MVDLEAAGGHQATHRSHGREELRPLYERIQRTDELIDQIVYRLYGLTEDEITVVEASVERG